MADNNSIKIKADVSEFKKSLLDLSRSINQNLGPKQGIQLFDQKTRDFITKEALVATLKIRQEMARMKTEAAGYREELEKSGLAEKKSTELRARLIGLERDRLRLLKESAQLEETSSRLSQGAVGSPGASGGASPGGAQGGAAGNASKILQSVPVVGTLMRGLANPWVLAGTLAVGLATKFATNSWKEFRQTIPMGMSLQGRGLSNFQGMSPEMAKLGFMPTEIQNMQAQSLDVFGKKNSEPGALSSMARMTRASGLDFGELAGAFSGVQAKSGTDSAAKTAQVFMANIFAKGVKEQIGPYLEGTNSLLSTINQDGLGLNAKAIGYLTSIAGNGEAMSPQRVAEQLGNIDQTVRGATGDRAAFMMTAFARAGIGGGILGGTQERMRMGLLGGNSEEIAKREGMGLLPKGYTQAMTNANIIGPNAEKGAIGGILKQFDQVVSTFMPSKDAVAHMSTAERKQMQSRNMVLQGNLAMGLMGGANGEEALERIGMLRKAQAGDKGAQSDLKSLMKTADQKVQESLDKIMTSPGGSLASIDAKLANIEVAMGIREAGVVGDVKGMQAAGEEAAGTIAGYFFKNPGEKATDKFTEDLMNAPDKGAQIRSLSNLDYQDKATLRKNLVEYEMPKIRREQMKWEGLYNEGNHSDMVTKNIGQLQDTMNNLMDAIIQLKDTTKDHNSTMKDHKEEVKKNTGKTMGNKTQKNTPSKAKQ